jgi:probable HAF family extracellular repeat protein
MTTKRIVILLRATVCLLSLHLVPHARAAKFLGLGDLPSAIASSNANDVSANGSVVVGQGITTLGVEAFRWTSGGGMVALGQLPSGTSGSVADGVSADGSVVV